MAIGTSLVGPYDGLPTHEKTRLQFAIPAKLAESLFVNHFPYRGSQDKIASRLFHTFVTILLRHHPDILSIDASAREEVVNHILNHIADSLDTYEPASAQSLESRAADA